MHPSAVTVLISNWLLHPLLGFSVREGTDGPGVSCVGTEGRVLWKRPWAQCSCSRREEGRGGLTAGGRARPLKLKQGVRSRYEERSQCNGAIDQDWGDAVMAVLEAFKA